MTDPTNNLALLQYGDSFFPTGGVSFSWGLETLCAEDRVTSAGSLTAFLRGQVRHRWAICDRVVLAAAYTAADDLEMVTEIDRLLEAQSLAVELRSGSRRSGAALLAIHEKLGTPPASDYRARVRAGAAPGHGAAVQGLMARSVGFDLAAAEALSAHTLCVGLLGAALRLGVVGHVDAQRSLRDVRGELAEILARPAQGLERLGAFTPEAEIAVMRHETAEIRLFAN